MELIFLTYINRSGSTFLANLFSGSDEILVCPEAEVIVNEYLIKPQKDFKLNNTSRKKIHHLIANDPKLNKWELNKDLFREMQNAKTNFEVFFTFLKVYKEIVKPSAGIILFKAERLGSLFQAIAKVDMPDLTIKFLAVLRDCRAIYASQKDLFIPETGKPMVKGPVRLALFWKGFVKNCQQLTFTNNLIFVSYEELILNLQDTFTTLLKKLELPLFDFSPESGDLLKRIPGIHFGLHLNADKIPIAEKTFNWKNELSMREIGLIEMMAKSELTSLGYKPIYLQNRYSLLWYDFIKEIMIFHSMRLINKVLHRINRSIFLPLMPITKFLNKRYFGLLILGFLNRRSFRNVESYCLFLGYARSGHSLIGAILDAHPNACISMELDVLNLIRLGFSRDQIYYYIFRNSRFFTNVLKNEWTKYSYAIPGQYQGMSKDIRVIGDKKGNRSTMRIGRDSNLMEQLKKITGCKDRYLHVVRHPLDNISTMVTRSLHERREPERKDFEKKIFNYFRNVRINHEIIQSGKLEILTLYHEDFIKNPKWELERILDFLNLEPIPSYIESCASIVYKVPHRSRDDILWPKDLKRDVMMQIQDFPFLQRYLSDE